METDFLVAFPSCGRKVPPVPVDAPGGSVLSLLASGSAMALARHLNKGTFTWP